jgi:polar amino acid transport system substrate-binding protein
MNGIKIIVLSILLIAVFPMPVKSETVLEKIQKDGVFKVAVREDAAPFGYLDGNKNLTGYCLDFLDLVKNKVRDELKVDVLTIRLLKSTSSNRFDLIKGQSAYLECGPNTISDNFAGEVNFSKSFFDTGLQFLIRKSDEKKIDVRGNLQGINIGLIGNTTTEKFVAERYPSANIKEFLGLTGRTRGVQALKQDPQDAQNRQDYIDGFVSDGILLSSELALQGLSSEDYSLIPEQPLTCDRYGMILTKNDLQWQGLVNSVIDSPEAKRIWKKWFRKIFNSPKVERDLCNKQSL